MTIKTAAERTFGIEIECYIPNAEMGNFARGSYHNGLQCPGLPEGWQGESDCSVTGGGAGYTAIEIVSPILRGEAGLCELWSVETILHDIGAKTDSHCGHHVHVDIQDYDERRVRLLVEQFAEYERLFYAMCGEKALERYNNSYCRPIRHHGVMGDRISRYRSLNLHNAWVCDMMGAWRRRELGHGTAECRCFPGNILPVWATTWVYMFTGIVTSVAMADDRVVPSRDWQTMTLASIEDQAEHFIKTVLGNADCRIVPDEPAPDLEAIIRHQIKRAAVVGF